MEYLATIFKMSLAQNMVLSQFLGLCPFIGVSRTRRDAVGMGFAVIFVMTMASVVTWAVWRFALKPFHIEYLRTICFILVIATLVQLVELAIHKLSPALYSALGIYLPLITTNCAVLGVSILNIKDFGARASNVSSFTLTAVQGVGGGLGFMVAMLLMSEIRERLKLLPIPRAFRGVPIAFICAGLLGLAFFGFAGLVR
jgi:electron transport complex protein RnfA